MSGNRRLLFTCGVVIFLLGGAILAFGDDRLGTPLGTTVALAGVVLMVWGWLGGRGDS
jgi:hypothetical protein